jgi:hypothetical protein
LFTKSRRGDMPDREVTSGVIMKKVTFQLVAFTLVISATLGCGIVTRTFRGSSSKPNPLTVQVKVDEQRATSEVISTSGGILSVQAVDGTKLTLTFPKGALLSDENITLTPVSSVDGLPFSGGLVGGVQIAPEGLQLFQPATLTVESPKTVAVEGYETVAFGYHHDGEGVYLNPSTITGNTLTLETGHFSGAVVAKATPAEIQAQQQRVPSRAEDAFIQRMQEYLGRERKRQLEGLDPVPEFEQKMGEFLREAYDSIIAPQLPIALRDCEAARPILSKALGWLRQVQLLGLDSKFQSESGRIMETMNQAIVNCYNKEYDQCVIDNKIEHKRAMIGFLRQALLLGIEDRIDQSKVEKCPKMSYRASGKVGNGTWSGVVCSLNEPFTVDALSPGLVMPFKFVPASPQAGTVSFDVTSHGVSWKGGGSYSVQGAGSENLKLVGNVQASYTAAGRTGPYGVPLKIDLTPLETNECNQP